MSGWADASVAAAERARPRRLRFGLSIVAIALGATALVVSLDRRGATTAGGEPVVERSSLAPGRIVLAVRNAGQEPVRIAQAIVDDAYVGFRAAHGHRHRDPVRARHRRWMTAARLFRNPGKL